MRQWLGKVRGDLRVARHLLGGGADFAFGAAFHAQQAAEKALKALLVWQQVDFPKTHDIERLCELLQTAVPQLPAPITQAIALTPYAVDVRYPADIPEPTLAEARVAVELAEAVQRAVLALLPAEFGPDDRAAG